MFVCLRLQQIPQSGKASLNLCVAALHVHSEVDPRTAGALHTTGGGIHYSGEALT